MPTTIPQEETHVTPPKKSRYTIFVFSLRTDGISLILFNYQLIGKKIDNEIR